MEEKLKLYRKRIIDALEGIDDTWLLNLIFESIECLIKED